MDDEIWKPIPKFDGYEASTHGRIRSIDRILRSGDRHNGRVLKLGTCTGGRRSVTIYRDCKRYCFQVHTLILLTFVGPCPAGLECCHGDGNHTNNRKDNLRWDTKRANTDDAIRHGVVARGTRHGSAKLDDQTVVAIRRDPRPQRVVADAHGVSQGLVSQIRTGRIWKHLAHLS